ncbi:GNAT family N-acetyltransferase [Lunatibacter salilacus]|uniref:GNAT family N-acetyltransferase n=1 Tax=Lunatibacter salilacus TaxID=2483804 RepID=UPI003743FD76
MIGPCFTFDNFRRQGLYFEALRLIMKLYSKNQIWIFAHESNLPSLKVIEKAGFTFVSDVKLNRITKCLTLK